MSWPMAVWSLNRTMPEKSSSITNLLLVELSGTDSDTALMGMAMLLEKEAIFNLKDMTVKVI